MSKVKTYDLEDTGSAYQQYREMVEQKEYEGDWVRIEDYKQLEKENAELKELLGEILCVPTTADEASRPANFDPNITGHRQSLIVNLSVSYDRLYRIQKKLEEQGK